MRGSTGTTKGGVAFVLALALGVAAALALTGNAMAETVQCAPTGMETVATPRDHYQAGEVATISGGGYALGCEVRVDVERPDGVVESFAATTDVGGNVVLDYEVPPPPGVLGQYTVVVRGLDGAALATTTFEDAPAPQFDIAPAHVAATGTHVFSALVRNTANASSDTARCVRITTPASVTVTSAMFVVANPGTAAGQTGNWTLSTGANFVEVRTDTNTRRGIFGSAPGSDNWARFEITANLASTGTGTWTSRMVTSNASCASGGSSDQLAVRVGGVFTREYTADFRNASDNVIAAPTAVHGLPQSYRIRVTRVAASDDLSYAAVALPPCLTNVTGISTTNSGGSSAPDFVATLTDNYFRFVTAGDKLSQNGQWTQVHFTATASCGLGSHVFRTASWKNTSPETAQDDIFKLQSGTSHPTLTVLSANLAPTVAAGNASVIVNEGQTATNTGVWGDANAADTVALSASVGTVVKSGTNGAGTWSWSYPTTDGPETQTVTITANDGTASTSTTFDLAVENVAPSATFDAPGSVAEGSAIDISLTDSSDPSPADTAAGFQYRFSCDGGATWTPWGSTITHACSTSDNGTKEVAGEIRDKDGGTSSYGASVTVTNVAPSATFNAPESVAEGSSIELSLTDVVDPGGADTHQYRFRCGDGDWSDWGTTATIGCPTSDDGSVTVYGQVRDDDGGTSAEYSASVAVNNAAPSATFNAPGSVAEGSAIDISLTDSSDPSPADTAAGFQYRFSCDGGATWTPWGSTITHACSTSDNGTKEVAGEIRDKDGGTSSYGASVTVTNVAPSATFNAPESVAEGSSIELSLTSPSDASSADTAAGFAYAFDCGDGSGYGAYSTSNSRSCPTTDDGTRSVKAKIADKDGGVTEYTATVRVDNVPPTLHSLTAGSYAVPVGTAVILTGAFSDPGSGDSFTCVIGWDDGSPAENISRPPGSTSCQASHTFAQQGVYSISMYVTDDDGGKSSTLTVIIAVYDPNAGGFVTGGGWLNSPAGSYAADPAASGRANFGFSSQYKKGASVPTGQTEFQLHFASFNFHSEAYEWLVVSGYKAQYKGTGRVNGVAGHGFMLTAYDGQLAGAGGSDRFRIKIWKLSGGVVYDTKMGTPDDMDSANPLVIGGGSIVIHKAK